MHQPKLFDDTETLPLFAQCPQTIDEPEPFTEPKVEPEQRESFWSQTEERNTAMKTTDLRERGIYLLAGGPTKVVATLLDNGTWALYDFEEWQAETEPEWWALVDEDGWIRGEGFTVDDLTDTGETDETVG